MTHSSKPRLLIVDDEADMLDFLERVLRRRFDVTRCSSAEKAFVELDRSKYDLLITDQKMPRMTGIELLDRISTTHPDLIKLLISGYTEMPEIQRAVAQGTIHNYIVKPVDSERLVEAVDEAYAIRAGRGTIQTGE